MVSGCWLRARVPIVLSGLGLGFGLGFIEIVKGLGAKNVLTESFDRIVLTETF